MTSSRSQAGFEGRRKGIARAIGVRGDCCMTAVLQGWGFLASSPAAILRTKLIASMYKLLSPVGVAMTCIGGRAHPADAGHPVTFVSICDNAGRVLTYI
jgi:hypothetical protein